MEKNSFFLKEGVPIGKNAPIALNVLIGANTESQMALEKEKIDALLECNLPISIITDLSLFTSKREQPLWDIVAKSGRCISGTVPVYQVVEDNGSIDKKRLLELIQRQAENGVRIITIHPTPTTQLLQLSKKRLIPITSRGGATVCFDMISNHRDQNIYLEILDDIISIARKEAVVLSIGSSFRSANLYDSLDTVYYQELESQLSIADYCVKQNVNAIIETPGHVTPQGLFKLCDYLKETCRHPIMPLGPMPTDCAFEEDDVAASIGAVLMGTRDCADILSIVTKDEHYGGIPSKETIISAAKKYAVAKHIIDIYKTGDSSADLTVAIKRSKNTSCIINSSDCSRCNGLCPLKTPLFEERE